VIHGDLERTPETALAAVLQFLDATPEDGPAAFLRRDRINSSFTRQGGVPAGEYSRPDPWATWSEDQKTVFRELAGADLCRYGLASPQDLGLPPTAKIPQI
jgi:hypothetical protein